MADRSEVESRLQLLLRPEIFKDYGPNGLQVEGRPEVRRIVSGVTASLAFIDAAIADGADTLLVHHGLFWRGQDGRLTGWLRQRVARLMAYDINLYAYHLPLNAHAEVGITGEISEPQAHLARETGVAFLACGHHASERYGAPAVAAHVAAQLGLEHRFIDVDNPA